MSKQTSLAACNALQPVDCQRFVPEQGVELPISPMGQEDIDMA